MAIPIRGGLGPADSFAYTIRPQGHLLTEGVGPVPLRIYTLERRLVRMEDCFYVNAEFAGRVDLTNISQQLHRARLVLTTGGQSVDLRITRFNIEYDGRDRGLRLRLEAMDDQWVRRPLETNIWVNTPSPVTQEANAKAKGLLERLLLPEQREEYRRTGKFKEVIADTTYTIGGIRIHVDRGGKTEEWCVGPEGQMPQADHFVAQLLHLRYDAKALRKTANVFLASPPVPRDLLHR